MAYKVQSGTAVLSGTIEQEGDIIVQSDDGTEAVRLDQDGTVSGSGELTVQSINVNNVSSISALGAASFGALTASALASLDGGINVNDSKLTISTAGAVSGSGGFTALSLDVNGQASIDGAGSGSLRGLDLNGGRIQDAGLIQATDLNVAGTCTAGTFRTPTDEGYIGVNGGARFTSIDNSMGTINNAGDIKKVIGLSFQTLPHVQNQVTTFTVSASQGIRANEIVVNSGQASINSAGTASVRSINVIRQYIGGVAASIDNAGAANVSSFTVSNDKFSVNASGDVSGSGDLELGGTTLKMDNIGNGTALAMGADSLLFKDAGTNTFHTASFAQLASALAGGGLTATNGVLSTQAAAIQEVNSANLTLKEGYNFMTASAALNCTLPASPSPGDTITFKTADLSGGLSVTINGAGSQTIDGVSSIYLESPYTAVSLVYVTTDDWRLI